LAESVDSRVLVLIITLLENNFTHPIFLIEIFGSALLDFIFCPKVDFPTMYF
jgi:hypothetical protein